MLDDGPEHRAPELAVGSAEGSRAPVMVSWRIWVWTPRGVGLPNIAVCSAFIVFGGLAIRKPLNDALASGSRAR